MTDVTTADPTTDSQPPAADLGDYDQVRTLADAVLPNMIGSMS